MSTATAILKNTVSGETVKVFSAKGRKKDGGVIDVWIDSRKQPLCAIGGELPSWQFLVLNNQPVIRSEDKTPDYPIGKISR